MSVTIIQQNEFLALKWAIAEQFQEYLLWKLFIVRTNNNLLTYIMTTPNLDATQHHWVESLARFTFSIEYHKGWNNEPMDALSQVTSNLGAELWSPSWMELPWEQEKEQMVMIWQWLGLMNRYISKSGKLGFWLELPKHMWTYMWLIGWPPNRRIQYLRPWLSVSLSGQYRIWNILLGDDTNTEEGKTILWEWKKLMLYHGALYHCQTATGKLEEVLQFEVPTAHQVATMEWHQGQQWILYLLHDQFWWPRRTMQMQKAISSWEWCFQHKGTHHKAPMQPIIVTAPLELLHMDFASIEMTMELHQHPNVGKIFGLLQPLYETHHGICDPWSNCKNIAKFLWQGYIYRSLEHWPSSWVTEEPTLKSTSSESFASLWPYRRLGLCLTMLKPTEKLNKLTKCWCTL